MKKVLSVLLAAAMVMGMSVSAFAAVNKNFSTSDYEEVDTAVNETIEFEDCVFVARSSFGENKTHGGKGFVVYDEDDEISLKPGDVLYFPLMNDGGVGQYNGDIDPDWKIKLTGKNVKSYDYYSMTKVSTTDKTTYPTGYKTVWGQPWDDAYQGYKFVKVVIADELDSTLSSTVKFNLWIHDQGNTDNQTEKVSFSATFANYSESIYDVDFDFINDVDQASKWLAKDAGKAIFSFESKAFLTIKMMDEEAVVLNLSTAYHKAVDKLFSNTADVDFYNFKGSKDVFAKSGELFIPADEDTYLYEVTEYDLTDADDVPEIEEATNAEWVEDYCYNGVNKKDGWVITTDELGYYVISDEELVVEEEEVEAPVVEDNKANPETGANDFVGAAVALAVVSVAAAGALALKK